MGLGGRRAQALAFATAFVTLFTQVLVHRMVSAKLLNNFAFLVISLTMLGFAFSGVILTRFLDRMLESLEDVLPASSALFVVSLLAASWAFCRADVGVLWVAHRPDFVRAFFRCLPLALLYAVPFTFCGLILGALLSSTRFPTERVYFFDLAGSALGAVAVIPAISAWGVEASTLAACGALLVLTVALVPPAKTPGRVLAAVAALALAAAVFTHERLFAMRGGERPPTAEGRGHRERVVWDPLSRIELWRIATPDPAVNTFPVLLGERPEFLARFQRMLSQNNHAPTFAVAYDGRPESLEGIEDTIYSAAYRASSVAAPRVLVIGVGGGFDVLTALRFGASEIVGVEVNGATVKILRKLEADYFAPWVRDPRVRLVHGEGRNFLATTDGRFDVLQISGVDSFSGTPAAAHVFSESYLYTREAFDLYLSRLTDDGMVNMMRYEYIPPNEMLRALTTAVAALRSNGVAHPARHVAMVSAVNHHFTAMLLKRTPFTKEELERLQASLAGNRLMYLAAAPGLKEGGTHLYQAFLSLDDPRLEAAFVARYPFDISPVDDNRPFFFRRSFWWHIFPADPVIWQATPAMEYGLILLLLIVGAATLACVYVPLRWLRGGPPPAFRRYGLFFASIGLGYLALEIALLQRFGLFLGHPNYALSVVLAGLLFFSGLGALASPMVLRRLRELRFVGYVLAALVLLEYLLILPNLPRLFGLPLAARGAIVILMVAPIGFCLGTYLPAGLQRLKAEAPGLVPWAWGVNGIFSVLTPLLAVGVSMTFGINALILAAIPVYLVAGFALPRGASSPAGSPLAG